MSGAEMSGAEMSEAEMSSAETAAPKCPDPKRRRKIGGAETYPTPELHCAIECSLIEYVIDTGHKFSRIIHT